MSALANTVVLTVLGSLLVFGNSSQSTETAFTSQGSAQVTVSAKAWLVNNLKASAFFATNATVTWSKVSDYNNYVLQWSASPNFTNALTASVSGTNFEVTELVGNTTYYFRVQAVGAPGTPAGSWSNVATVKTPEEFTSRLVGSSGWQTSLIAPIGDLDGDGKRDFVRQDNRITAFYFYNGDGAGSHVGHDGAGRYMIDRNFPLYNHFFGVGDWTKDGRDDIMTIDEAGDLWLYSATPKITLIPDKTNAFNPRLKIATGWGGLFNVVGVNDVTGDGNNDILAITPAGTGTLKVYPGLPNNKFGTTITIGTGWGQYGSVVPIGDLNGDGKPDLLALNKNDGSVWFYAGTGTANASMFKARVQVPGMRINPDNVFVGVGDMTSDGIADMFEMIPTVNSADGKMYSWSGYDIKKALGY